jgi:hypothetical protein
MHFHTGKRRIEFRTIDSQMIIYNALDIQISDTLSAYTCKNLTIQSPNLFNYKRLLSLIKPDKLEKIRFRDFNHQRVFSLYLKKFKKLNVLEISGDNFLQDIFLKGNLSCKLKEASFYSSSLIFPAFDSALVDLKEFDYNGASTVLPRWLNKLNHLESMWLRGSKIQSIDCDLCSMPNLKALYINETPLYQSELKYKERYGKYNILQKYMDCKPDLELEYRLPPY